MSAKKKFLFRHRLLFFGCALLSFLAVPAVLFMAPTFPDMDSPLTWLAMGLIGCVTMWPLLFRRSALHAILTSVGIILALLIVIGRCNSFFDQTWCNDWGQTWLFTMGICALYCVTLLHLLRMKIKRESWREGAALGLVPYIMLFVLFPHMVTSFRSMPDASFPLIQMAMYAIFAYMFPLLSLSWLTHQMIHEGRGKNWKTAWAF